LLKNSYSPIADSVLLLLLLLVPEFKVILDLFCELEHISDQNPFSFFFLSTKTVLSIRIKHKPFLFSPSVFSLRVLFVVIQCVLLYLNFHFSSSSSSVSTCPLLKIFSLLPFLFPSAHVCA